MWANNATGSLQQLFDVYIGGTSVDFSTRSDWLSARIAGASTGDELMILAGAAAQGRETNSFRMRDFSPFRAEPDEWRPATGQEERAARRLAALNLLACVQRAPQDRHRELGKLLAGGLWALIDAEAIDWIASEIERRELREDVRAEMLGAVVQATASDTTQTEPLRRLRSLLEGRGVRERLGVALRTSVWDLAERGDEVTDVPRLLLTLADEIAGNNREIEAALRIDSSQLDEQTRFVFLRLLAERVGASRLASFAEPHDIAVLAACLSVADERGESEWVDRVLAEFAIGERAAHLALLATYVELTDRRANRVLDDLVAAGASAAELARLVGGARVRALSYTTAARVIRAVADAGRTSDALLMFDQATKEGGALSVRHPVGFELASAKLEQGSRSMDNYLVIRLVDRDVFSADELEALWWRRMLGLRSLAADLDVRLSDAFARASPEAFAAAVFRLVRRQAHGDAPFSFFVVRDLHLLARAAEATEPDEVIRLMAALDERELRLACHHLRWSGDSPDPLTAKFLESEILGGYETEAFTAFFNTLGVVSGSYWRALERERTRAEHWASELSDSSRARQWAIELVSRYEQDIVRHREREAEEDLRTGG